MLSPDVPEFIPRGYQTPDSTNTVNFKSTESTSQPQQTKSPPSTHKPPLHARSSPLVPKNYPLRGEREKTGDLRKQNDTWRQPREAFGNQRESQTWRQPRETFGNQRESQTWRQPREAFGNQRESQTWRQPREAFGNQRESQTHEVIRHESGTETLPRNDSSAKNKLPEKHISQKSKRRPKTVSENLEFHIKNKFITAPNPPYSYTRILKSKQPANSTPEGKSSKQQDFSFSTEGQWPTLGESLPPHKMPERSNDPPGAEKGNSNPWLSRSSEGSPMKNTCQERDAPERTADASVRPRSTEITSPIKCPMKNPANYWQERGVAEQTADVSVRPRSTEITSPIKHHMNKPANPWQERGSTERNGDASVRPRTEINSLIKKSRKVLASAWQERSTAEQIANSAVKLRITEGNAKTSENSVKTKPASHTPQRKAETDSPKLGSKSTHVAKDQSNKHDNEPGSLRSNVRNAMNTEAKNSLGIQSQEEAVQVTRNTTTQDDSDLFQWKVIGEKKKKVKIKKPQEEVRGSPQLQALLKGEGNKYGRVLADKPSPNDSGKENHEYTRKIIKNYVVDLSKTKGVHSLSNQGTQGAIKKDAVAPKAGQKDRKKSRPTKVMSLANCSNDKKETRPNPKISTTTATTKPVDEKILQRKLAAKLMKKEEKKKLKEMKASEALNQPKDTKVSFITASFLEKTQMPTKASVQPSTTGAERMNFTFEEYPTLQMQRNTTPSYSSNKDGPKTSSSSLPSNRDAHQNSTPSLPSDKDAPQALSSNPPSNTSVLQNSKRKPTLKITKKSPSTKGRLQVDDLLSGLLPLDTFSSDDDSDASDECTTTYKTALLSAKEKMSPDHRHTKLTTNSPIDTTPQKKKVRTKDPIQLNLFALAAQSGKNKKKSTNYAEKFSPAKRRLFEDKREEEVHARKTVVAALPKGTGVVAKRGKINAKKPKKKKISRVQRCKMEKQRKEVLALQLLLEQAKLRQQQQQQGVLEASPTLYNETEESSKEADNEGRGENTNEPLTSTTKTEADKEGDEKTPDKDEDEEKQKTSVEKNEGKTEDCDENKENESSCEALHPLPNINSQVINTPAKGDDNKPKLIWKIKDTQYSIAENKPPVPEESSNSGMKDKSTDDEGKASNEHPTEEESMSSLSPTHQKLLTDDPLIAEKASELIDLIKSQKYRQKGPREYCHQVVTPEVNTVAKKLITSLITFQKRHYQRDPTKARIRKRYVCGLKETTKLMGKMSCIIMAPNIQQCEGPGSLDDAVEKLLNQAEKFKVPVVFALSTKEMRNLCHKSSRKVSCFGIISYQGAQDLFQHLMQLLPEAQKQYQQLVASGQCTLPKEGEEEEEEEEEGEPAKMDLTEKVLAHTTTLLMAP